MTKTLDQLRAEAEEKRKNLIKDKALETRGLLDSDSLKVTTLGAPTSEIASPINTKIIDTNFLSQLSQIPNLLEVEDNEQEHIVIYGEPKSGKTLAAALLSEFYELLWMDGDKGLKSAMNILPEEMQKRIHVIKVPDNTFAPMYWNTMLKVVTGRKVNLCIAHGYIECAICKGAKIPLVSICLNDLPANWVVVEDSITQFVSSAIAAINRKTFKLIDGDTNDEGKFGFDEWGNLKQIAEKHGNYIKDLSCKFIGISHETMAVKEDKASALVPVGGSETTSSQFARYFSSCIYAKKINGKHNYISGSVYSSSVQSGTRSNIVLEKEVTPSMLHIFDPKNSHRLLKGSWNEWFFKPEAEKAKLPQPKVKELVAP